MKLRMKKLASMLLLGCMVTGSIPGGMAYAAETEPVAEEMQSEESADNAQDVQDSAASDVTPDLTEGVQDDAESQENADVQDNADIQEDAAIQDNTEDTADQNTDSDTQSEDDAAVPGNDGTEAESVDSEETAEKTQEDSIIEKNANEINYVFVESPYLETPGTERIAVSYGDGSENISDMSLTVRNNAGQDSVWDMSASAGQLYLFANEFSDSSATGTYEVISLNVTDEEGARSLFLSDSGMEAYFGVNEEYSGIEELQPLDAEAAQGRTADETAAVEATVAEIDPENIEGTTEQIVNALENAESQTGSVSDIAANVAAFSASAARSAAEPRANGGNIVIALDPGHDSIHAGASSGGLKEEVLTLKIAQYCKAELEKYAGVTVYMTRTTAACPYPNNSSSGGDIGDRVTAAADAGAVIYVSFHLNSSTSSSPNGSEVIVPNNSWKPEVAQEARELARAILDELKGIGLNMRPDEIYSKDTTVDERYPDGSISDYYSVQIYAKERGIPGIIVEHAFISNSSDRANYLSTEAGLKKLGVADATGIAKYLGLSKEPYLTLDTYNYTGTVGETYCLLAKTNNWDVIPTVEVGNEEIVKVERLNVDDNRGYLYNLTGLKEGSTQITFTQGDKKEKANVTYVDKGGFLLDTSSLTIDEGKVYQFLAKTADKSIEVPEVQSSNPEIATVKLISTTDRRGYLYQIDALRAGKTEIIVSNNVTEKSFPVTVKEGTFLLDTYNYQGKVGQIYGLLVMCSNRAVEPTVEVEDKDIVRVKMLDANDSRGYLYQIEGLSAGSTTITFRQSGKEAKMKVTYTLGNDFSLDTKSLTTKAGSIYQFLAKITDKTGDAPTAVSDDPKVATVQLVSATDSRGYLFQVNAVSAGKTTIRVTYQGIEKSFPVTVTAESDMKLDTYNYTGYVGQVYGLLVMTSDRENEPKVTVKDESIVSVELYSANDSRGYLYHLTGLKAGSTTITVEQNGKEETLKVTYKPVVDYELDTKSLTTKAGSIYQFLAKITDKTGDAPTAVSDDPKVATVQLVSATDSRGYLFQVNAVSAGKTTIRVTYQGTEKSFPVTVESDLSLDTYYYVGRAGQVYGLLVMTDDRTKEPTITVKDDKIVSVELADKNDSRGYLYHLTGLKAGSTEIIVEQNHNQQVLKVTYTDAVYDVDTKTVSIKQGELYNFLVKGAIDASLVKIESSDTRIARCSLYNANDSRGIMYQIAAFKDGTATLTIDYCGTIKKIEVTVVKADLYEICGKSGVTASDLVNLYNSSGKEYPAFYKDSDAPSLEEFCEIYYEETTAEGIKPEVAFCQAMLETSWLQYGGDVKIEQYNFAGLGATGNGAPGNSFPSVRIGIRAQIQHLKAYAVEGITEDDLKYPCVDVRFKYVNKGSAPYLEWLGIQENPYGSGWATGKNYGYNIRKIIDRI